MVPLSERCRSEAVVVVVGCEAGGTALTPEVRYKRLPTPIVPLVPAASLVIASEVKRWSLSYRPNIY